MDLQPSTSASPQHSWHLADHLGNPEVQRALERLRNGVLRGAIVGCTLRGGLHLLGAALTPLTGRKKRRSVTPRAAFWDTLRYTAFLGSLAGIYIGVDEGIAGAFGKRRTKEWRSLVAGICAGQALVLTGPRQRHYSLATYILLRGLTLLVRTGNRTNRRPLLHKLLAPTRLEHGDTLLMCLSCSQVIYAFLMMPQTLPVSYVRFIRKQGAKELYVWQAIRELAQRTTAGQPISPLTSLMGTPHAEVHSTVPCPYFHPGQDCWSHAAGLVPQAYVRALSVYLPVYLLPALLVHRQQLLKDPSGILGKVVLGTARSSLFLSLLISAAFAGACGGHRLAQRSTGSIIALGVSVGGLATLLEKKSRRMELALYVLSRALESFSRCLVEWRVVNPALLPPRMDVLLFAAGVGAILHCYSDGNGRHRSVFRSKYLNVLDFVFGNTGINEGSIKHVPSNQDLLSSVHRKVRSLSNQNLLALGEARRSEEGPGGATSSSSSPLRGATAAAATSALATWVSDDYGGAGSSSEGAGRVVAAASSSVAVVVGSGGNSPSRLSVVSSPAVELQPPSAGPEQQGLHGSSGASRVSNSSSASSGSSREVHTDSSGSAVLVRRRSSCEMLQEEEAQGHAPAAGVAGAGSSAGVSRGIMQVLHQQDAAASEAAAGAVRAAMAALHQQQARPVGSAQQPAAGAKSPSRHSPGQGAEKGNLRQQQQQQQNDPGDEPQRSSDSSGETHQEWVREFTSAGPTGPSASRD